LDKTSASPFPPDLRRPESNLPPEFSPKFWIRPAPTALSEQRPSFDSLVFNIQVTTPRRGQLIFSSPFFQSPVESFLPFHSPFSHLYLKNPSPQFSSRFGTPRHPYPFPSRHPAFNPPGEECTIFLDASFPSDRFPFFSIFS